MTAILTFIHCTSAFRMIIKFVTNVYGFLAQWSSCGVLFSASYSYADCFSSQT